jgi:hypothetical protein
MTQGFIGTSGEGPFCEAILFCLYVLMEKFGLLGLKTH